MIEDGIILTENLPNLPVKKKERQVKTKESDVFRRFGRSSKNW